MWFIVLSVSFLGFGVRAEFPTHVNDVVDSYSGEPWGHDDTWNGEVVGYGWGWNTGSDYYHQEQDNPVYTVDPIVHYYHHRRPPPRRPMRNNLFKKLRSGVAANAGRKLKGLQKLLGLIPETSSTTPPPAQDVSTTSAPPSNDNPALMLLTQLAPTLTKVVDAVGNAVAGEGSLYALKKDAVLARLKFSKALFIGVPESLITAKLNLPTTLVNGKKSLLKLVGSLGSSSPQMSSPPAPPPSFSPFPEGMEEETTVPPQTDTDTTPMSPMAGIEEDTMSPPQEGYGNPAELDIPPPTTPASPSTVDPTENGYNYYYIIADGRHTSSSVAPSGSEIKGASTNQTEEKPEKDGDDSKVQESLNLPQYVRSHKIPNSFRPSYHYDENNAYRRHYEHAYPFTSGYKNFGYGHYPNRRRQYFIW